VLTFVDTSGETILVTSTSGHDGMTLKFNQGSSTVDGEGTITVNSNDSIEIVDTDASLTWDNLGFSGSSMLTLTLIAADGTTTTLSLGAQSIDSSNAKLLHLMTFDAFDSMADGTTCTVGSGNGTCQLQQFVSQPDELQRSSGSWWNDGFRVGDVISVAGTVNNDGSYTIQNISTDGSTLYFDPATQITDESVSGATVLLDSTEAGGVEVRATQAPKDDSTDSTYAYANGSSGTLIGYDGSFTEASNSGHVEVGFGKNSSLTTFGDLSLIASQTTKQNAVSTNILVGILFGYGSAYSTASTDTTTLATLGEGATIHADNLTVTAVSVDTNNAVSTAGSGGVIGVAGVETTTNDDSTTTAEVKDGAHIYLTNVGAGAFNLTADHTANINGTIKAEVGGVIAGTGARLNDYHDAAVDAKIDSSAAIYARLINVNANNRVVLTDKSNGTTGGVASVASSDGYSDLVLNTNVTIGNSAHLEVVGSASDDLTFNIAALNVINADVKIVFISGGALVGADHSNLTIYVKTDNANVTIGSDAVLIAAGAMTISARGRGSIVGQADIETDGAASVSVGTTKVQVMPTNTITVNDRAHLTAMGDMSLVTGRDSNPDMATSADYYVVTARWDGFAGSAIPISNVDARAYIVQTNTVTLNSGSYLSGARQINLYAERLGVVDLLGKAKAVSWISEVGDAINSLLGGGGEEQYVGDALSEAHGNVIVNGTVETGITRNVSLNITGWDINAGTVTATASTGVTYTVSIKGLENDLVQSLRSAEYMLATFGSLNSTLKNFYTQEIARIKQELDDEGLSETVTRFNSATGTWETEVIYPSIEVLTVTVDPIYASAGRIDVRADQLGGSGNFIAPSDASVTIINNTPAFLELKGIYIPEENGGVYLNGSLVTDVADINTSNQSAAHDDNEHNFSGVDSHVDTLTAGYSSLPQPTTNAPVIDVENTLNINEINDADHTYQWPDIIVLSLADDGTGLYNDSGTIILSTLSFGHSNIRIFNTVRARNISVISGGSVYLDGLVSYSIGGEEADLMKNATLGTYDPNTGAKAGGISSALNNWVQYYFAMNDAPKSPYSLYGDRVHIAADYINVNGILQSGLDTYSLTLDDSALLEVLVMRARGKTGRFFLPTTSKNNPGFEVYFNTITNRFEVEEVKTSGGYVELIGHIANTGYGDIRVLGGYPTINITNSTSIDLALNRINISERGTGTLLLVDYSAGNPDTSTKATHSSDPYVTLYQWTESGLIITTNGGTGSSEVSTLLSSYASSYLPEYGLRYGWTTVLDRDIIKKKHIKSGSWLGIIPDVFQKENIKWDSVEVQGAPHYGGSGPYYYYQTGVDDYTYNLKLVVTSDTGPVRTYHHSYWTWYGSHVYVEDWQEIQGQELTYTHTMTASRTINITFTGNEAGAVSINSIGSVILLGGINNPSGTTTINTSGSLQTSGEGTPIVSRQINITAAKGVGTAANPLAINLVDVPYNFLSSDGSQELNTPAYNYTTGSGSVNLYADQTVRVGSGYDSSKGAAGAVYKYVGNNATINLSTANYFDTTKWVRVFSSSRDVVDVNGVYYTYVGTPTTLDLGNTDYTDTTIWKPVKLYPGLTISSGGGVYVSEISGNLYVNNISATKGSAVVLNSAGGILPAYADNAAAYTSGLVQGGNVTLTANGIIGLSSDHPIQLDSSMLPAGQTKVANNTKVNVTGKGNIFLEEIAGDLWLEQLTTDGDVWIKIDDGSLIDANKYAERDERTYDELYNGIWSDLQLTSETGAATKIANLIASFEAVRTSEYNSYWQYKNSLDAGGHVTLTTVENDYFTNYYTQLGQSQGLSGSDLTTYIQNALTTLRNSRQDQYDNLKTQYASLTTTFDPDYHYTATDAEIATITASVKVWTEDQLLNLISSSILKTITDTTLNVEAPNIIARNVTIIVSNSVGTNNPSATLIDLTSRPTPIVFTADELAQLSAAEASDITFLAALPISTEVNFSSSASTIYRTDGSSWSGAGFAAGDYIMIAGSLNNDTNPGQYYKIASIDGAVMTLADATLYKESYSQVSVAPVVVDPSTSAASIKAIQIWQRDDINFDLTGTINISAVGNVYIGSGQQDNDLKIEHINTTGNVRVKSVKGILNQAYDGLANITSAGEVILEAADGGIGTRNDPPVHRSDGYGLHCGPCSERHLYL